MDSIKSKDKFYSYKCLDGSYDTDGGIFNKNKDIFGLRNKPKPSINQVLQPDVLPVDFPILSKPNLEKSLDLVFKFFSAQQSGKVDPMVIPWRRTAHLTDGVQCQESPNLAGGYYADGTFIKHIWPMSYSATTIALTVLDSLESESSSVWEKSNQKKNLLSVLKEIGRYIINGHLRFLRQQMTRALKINNLSIFFHFLTKS